MKLSKLGRFYFEKSGRIGITTGIILVIFTNPVILVECPQCAMQWGVMLAQEVCTILE
jgi:hypothetical protein